VTRRRWLIAALLLMTSTACMSSHSSMMATPGSGGTGQGQALTKLIAKADLQPCPHSSATTTSGGLPDLTLPCLGNGPAVHLAGLTGKPMVLITWGSWCTECQAEMRFLSSAYDHDRRQVRFLGVDTVDEADSALDFDAHVSPPVHFPSVFDEGHKVELGLHTDATPYTVFVSPTGQIVHTRSGPYGSTAQLQADITTYLHVTA
jgi:cytochrome c biogenesis protein CcmG/thiol:disulfide interchange protein DsbE